MYPNDAKTIFLQQGTGTTTGNILPSVNYDRTLLNIGINCSTVNNTVLVGSVKVLETVSANERFYKSVSYKIPLNTAITYTKTNQTTCFFTLVYTDYDLSLYGSAYPASFTGGDMFSSFLLFVGLIIAISVILIKAISNVPVHEKYIGVNQLEGKKKYKI